MPLKHIYRQLCCLSYCCTMSINSAESSFRCKQMVRLDISHNTTPGGLLVSWDVLQETSYKYQKQIYFQQQVNPCVAVFDILGILKLR